MCIADLLLCSGRADKRFKIVHCAGYLKAWVPSSGDVAKEPDEEGCNLSCLVSWAAGQTIA